MATSEKEHQLNLRRISEGRWPFSIPYGYKEGNPQIVNVRHKDGDKTRLRRQIIRTIEIDPVSAPIVRRLFDLYISNQYTISDIQSLIYKEFKKRMHKSAIYRILESSFYIGKMEYRDHVFAHKYGSIVSQEIFNEAQYIRKAAINHRTDKPVKYAFPFKDILACESCKGSITAEKQKGHSYYHCTFSQSRHKFRYVRYEKIYEYIVSQLRGFSLEDSFMDKFSEETQKDIRYFLDHMVEWFIAGPDGKRNAIANLLFEKISISAVDEIVFSARWDDVWQEDAIPTLFAKKFYPVYLQCTNQEKSVDTVENTKKKISPPEIIRRMCAEPRSFDELIAIEGVTIDEVQEVLFDLHMSGKIEQDMVGRWRTLK